LAVSVSAVGTYSNLSQPPPAKLIG